MLLEHVVMELQAFACICLDLEHCHQQHQVSCDHRLRFWVFHLISNIGEKISYNNLQLVSADSCMPGKQQINATACKSKI